MHLSWSIYSLPNTVRVIKSRRMRWAGHVARMGVQRGVYRVLVGKPEGKRPLGRPRRRWVVNIRMDLQEVGCGHVEWIGLAQDRDRWRTLVSAVMNLRLTWNAGNFLTSCKPVSCSGRTLHRRVSELSWSIAKIMLICTVSKTSKMPKGVLPLSFVILCQTAQLNGVTKKPMTHGFKISYRVSTNKIQWVMFAYIRLYVPVFIIHHFERLKLVHIQ